MTRLTHPSVASIPRREWLTAALIVLMALALRVYTVAFNHFRGDEAGLVSIAQQMLSEHRLPLLGINSSVLVPNSPASVYLIALPYLVVKNPLLATDFVALLNAIGVGLLWLLARQLFSPAVGLVAALIYAASPWAIWFSSKIWEQNLYTPLVILGLLLGWWGYMEGRRWAQALCWPIMIFGLQMHYAGWTLLPLLPLLVAAGRRRIWLPALAAGLLLASLTLAPFALGLQQNSASDVYSGSHIASILKQIPPSLTHLSGQGMVALSWLSSGSGLDRYLGGNQQVKLATQVPAPLAIQLGFGLLTGIGLLKVWQYATKPASMLICLWALLPVAIFTPSWTAAPPHYFTAILPALAVLGGVSVSWLMRTRWTILLAFGLCASVILTMGWWLALLNFLDVTPTSESGTPLHRMMDVRTELLHYDDVVLTLDGTLGLTDYDIWTPMLWRSASCLRRPVMNDGGIAVLPGHPFAALRAPDAHAPVDDGLYLQGHPYSFPLRPGEGAYTIFTFDQAPPWNGPALTDLQPITFDSRLQLTGYALKYNRVYLRWQVGQPPMHNYRFFIDFLDNAGGLKAQHEAILYEYHSICQGDVLITWNDLARPVEAVTLRVGIYGADNEHGAGPQNIVPDSTGNRIGTWADIPLPAGGS